MTEQVEVAGHTVEIRRHARAKHMRLAVNPGTGTFRLTIPKRVSLRSAVDWAREQREWVGTQARAMPQPQSIRSGMLIPVGDDRLTLVWAAHHRRVPRRDAMQLCVGGVESDIAAPVLRWLKREALRVLTEDTAAIAARAGATVRRVGVGDPRSRWGSCSAAGDIRYSWRLIMAPSSVRRATVAHEVAHRVHMNHSPAFHALVRALLGDDPTPSRDWLRLHGNSLHGFGREN